MCCNDEMIHFSEVELQSLMHCSEIVASSSNMEYNGAKDTLKTVLSEGQSSVAAGLALGGASAGHGFCALWS